MLRLSLTMLAVGLSAFAAAAAPDDTAAPPAQAAPAGDDARYSFHRSGDSFIRLDSRTGQVSQCGWGGTGWSCKLVPDERAALESELSRLQRDNAQLKKSLLSHNIELPSGIVAEAPAAAPVPPMNVPDPSAKAPQMPSGAELDRAFAFMKNVWRRMIDMMVDLQRDMKKS